MNGFKRILVVCRMPEHCRKAVHYGVSLAQKYGAALYVIHVIHNPFSYEGWNLPIPSFEGEYRKLLEETKSELDKTIDSERKKGVTINELIKEGEPAREILKSVREENIDLLIMLAHEEGRLEHFLFGRSNEEIIRKMPCSILLIKQEPGPVRF